MCRIVFIIFSFYFSALSFGATMPVIIHCSDNLSDHYIDIYGYFFKPSRILSHPDTMVSDITINSLITKINTNRYSTLNLEGTHLTNTRDLTSILNALNYTSSSITKLNLSDTNLTEPHAVNLAQSLKYNKTIKELEIRDNPLNSSGVCALFNALADNQILQSLDLSGVKLIKKRNDSEEMCEEICIELEDQLISSIKNFERNTSITKLDLSCSLNDDFPKVTDAVLDMLQNKQDLQVVSLFGNNLSNKLEAIYKLMIKVKDLNIGFTRITIDPKIISLLKGETGVLPYLEKLDLSCISLDREKLIVIANWIEQNNALTEIDLNNCNLDKNNARPVVKALSKHPQVKRVGLSDNANDDNFLYLLCHLASRNPRIKTFNLEDWSFTPQTAREIFARGLSGIMPTSLILSYCCKSVYGNQEHNLSLYNSHCNKEKRIGFTVKPKSLERFIITD